MAKSDVLALVVSWSNGQADAVLAETFYDEMVLDLARRGALAVTSVLAGDVGATTYTVPERCVSVLACFYDDAQLWPALLAELEARNPRWREESGTPIAVVTEDETAQTFRLYPRPDAASQPWLPLVGAVVGRDYPSYSVGLMHTETMDDVPVWLEVPLTCAILSREYARESAHRDERAAVAWQKVAAGLLALMESQDAKRRRGGS